MVQCPEKWFLAKMLFAPLQDFKLRQDKSKIIRLEFNCVDSLFVTTNKIYYTALIIVNGRNNVSTINNFYTHNVYFYRDNRQSIYAQMKTIRDFANSSVYDYCFNHKVIFPSSKRFFNTPSSNLSWNSNTIFNSQVIWRKPTSNFVV
jgi:hypothetical protein